MKPSEHIGQGATGAWCVTAAFTNELRLTLETAAMSSQQAASAAPYVAIGPLPERHRVVTQHAAAAVVPPHSPPPCAYCRRDCLFGSIAIVSAVYGAILGNGGCAGPSTPSPTRVNCTFNPSFPAHPGYGVYCGALANTAATVDCFCSQVVLGTTNLARRPTRSPLRSVPLGNH